MIRKTVGGLLLLSVLTGGLYAYDTKKAEEFNGFYSHMTQKACADSKLMIGSDEVMQMLREEKKFTLLDIRTRGELAVLGLKTPNTLEIPLEHLFEKANLGKLPDDELIVIVCYSGTRATMAVASLKMLGFKNTRVLRGGIVAMAQGNTPKTAPMK
jgi:rhodanese-related sulfurtransferase